MRQAVICLTMVAIMMTAIKTYGEPARIWCIGDSITKGPPSYRKDLFFLLNEAGLDYDFVGTRNNASSSYPLWTDQDHDGWGSHTSGNILNGGYTGPSDAPFPGIAAVVGDVNPDIVLLHIGTNDYSLPVTTSMNNIHGIINAVRNNNPDVIFFVANMIPIGQTKFQDANNALAAAITSGVESYSTEDSPVYLVDMRSGYDMAWFTDLVHPDSRGQAFMAERWADAIMTNVVPEPATAAILASAGVAIMRRRGKRR